jgi:dTDP-4-amino-4,6-dideoxygalactose transaminase
LLQWLLDQQIVTRRGIMLSHTEPAYAGHPVPSLPNSERASARSFLLPLYPQMTSEDQDRVIAALFRAAAAPAGATASRAS